MSKISTHRAMAQTTISTSSMSHSLPSPRAATLARVRQFARAYAAPVSGLPGLVLN